MKVLLGECVPHRLAAQPGGHNKTTARQVGWTSINNGKLLVLANAEFDVFVTVDRNLSFQQDLGGLRLAVIVLGARSNRYQDLPPLVPQITEASVVIRSGGFRLIGP